MNQVPRTNDAPQYLKKGITVTLKLTQEYQNSSKIIHMHFTHWSTAYSKRDMIRNKAKLTPNPSWKIGCFGDEQKELQNRNNRGIRCQQFQIW